MLELKRTLDVPALPAIDLACGVMWFCVSCVQGHCVLEMSSGTGKTVSLFSLIVSYFLVSGVPQAYLKVSYHVSSFYVHLPFLATTVIRQIVAISGNFEVNKNCHFWQLL